MNIEYFFDICQRGVAVESSDSKIKSSLHDGFHHRLYWQNMLSETFAQSWVRSRFFWVNRGMYNLSTCIVKRVSNPGG